MQKLQEQLHYQFKDLSLLKRALTHRSVRADNNERLEFLGDAILGFIVADELFNRYPNKAEGQLSRMRSGMVKRETLASLAQQLKLSEFLIVGPGEEKCGGQSRESILSDTLEAILGAIYCDSRDLQACRQCILKWFGEEQFDEIAQQKIGKDAKSALQEWLQARQMPLPTYEVSTSGKAHEQQFLVACRVDGLAHEATGESTSRRKAEQIAAMNYLQLLSS